MERSSKRGKIPQQDWPSIIKRYEAGETLASIARTYDCSPPAISYILSRSRSRETTSEGTEQGASDARQPLLIKAYADAIAAAQPPDGETNIGGVVGHAEGQPAAQEVAETGHELSPDGRTHFPEGVADAFDRGTEIVVHQAEQNVADAGHAEPSANGTSPSTPGPAGASSQNGEPRRTLRLSLSHDDAHRPNSQPHDAVGSGAITRSEMQPAGGQHGLSLSSGQQGASAGVPVQNGGTTRMAPESHRQRDGGAFIDQALRTRVEGDITVFLAAFDAALAHDTLESRAGLREATDRLLRAGARTRIELERLEARIPLPVRDGGGPPGAAWRPR
jgi:hypothetical protein